MAPRRSKIELVRDLLLSLAMAPNQTEKPTRLMYATGTSWRTIMGRDADPNRSWEEEEGLIDLCLRKNLIENIGPGYREKKGPRGRANTKRDRRTPSLYKITDRGLLVLRLMDLLWVYLEGEQPQVRMPPAILRILARATNYGESLDGIVQNIAYAPRLSTAEADLETLLDDMKEESVVISEGAPDTERLTQALQVVVDDRAKTRITMAEKAQAAHEMPAKFFVNQVIKGIEEIEAATGEQSMPVVVESTFEVVDEVTIDPSAWSETHGLKCPICGYRIYSTSTERTMKAHFKVKHPNLTPVFKDA